MILLFISAMTLVQKLRLFIYCGFAPFNKLIMALFKHLPDTVQQEVRGIRFVGPGSVVEDATNVLTDFESADPELCSALYKHAPINFYYDPRMKRDASYMKYFVAGEETIVWGKTGVLANMVWTAFKLKANLHVPAVSFRDFYNGSVLQRNACLEMSEWLKEHNQPSELVEVYFAAYSRAA